MDRSERDRAAMAQAGLAPVLLSDSEACHGHIRITRQPLGLCVNCARYGNGTTPTLMPAAKMGEWGWDCPNRRSLGAMLDAETVAAVDEMAMVHVGKCSPSTQGAPRLPVGGSDVQQHTSGVSSRAGEGG